MLVTLLGLALLSGKAVSEQLAQTQTLYGQCGGRNWAGATVCGSGAQCTAGNEWYSQCVAIAQPNNGNQGGGQQDGDDEGTQDQDQQGGTQDQGDQDQGDQPIDQDQDQQQQPQQQGGRQGGGNTRTITTIYNVGPSQTTVAVSRVTPKRTSSRIIATTIGRTSIRRTTSKPAMPSSTNRTVRGGGVSITLIPDEQEDQPQDGQEQPDGQQ